MKVTNASVQYKRDVLNKLLGSGKIATLVYTDAKGVIQQRQAKLWIERHLTSGDRNVVGVNIPAQMDERIYPYSDLNKDQFKSVRLDRLHKVTSGGVVYEFN